MRETLSARRHEFYAHVWNHSEDVFQQSFDLRAPIPEPHMARLLELVAHLSDGADDEQIAIQLGEMLQEDADLIFTAVQLVGLTREKLRTDVKPALAQSGVRTPSKITSFATRQDVWSISGPYLAKRLRTVLANFLGLPPVSIASAIEALNQATWPGYIRQERAKRSGGEAEQRLAIMLRQLGLPFVPEGKADNGLTKDASFGGESFDLIVPDEVHPRVCVIAMVHAANIGQYGESKADDARRARVALGSRQNRPLLGVLADGVGFDSNRAGLDGLLTHADEFFQFNTLWKAAVIASQLTGHTIHVVLPDAPDHQQFLDRYSRSVVLHDKSDNHTGWVVAGEAIVRVERAAAQNASRGGPLSHRRASVTH